MYGPIFAKSKNPKIFSDVVVRHFKKHPQYGIPTWHVMSGQWGGTKNFDNESDLIKYYNDLVVNINKHNKVVYDMWRTNGKTEYTP